MVEEDPDGLIKELTKDDEEEREDVEHLAENKTDLYRYVLFAYLEENYYLAHSDWKFDPADMEYYVSHLIGKPFPIDCPDETYGSDLFPYVQAQLAQENKELVNLDSFGDSYGFIVVEKDKVARLMHICNSYGIAMDVL
ncbi:MAG: hypothetical protein MUD08_15750 [Cytophagales bacterium]|nr:hypothetical protein [Cytophagales bacterium]